MELLWIFGISTKAFAWITLISAAVLALLFVVGVSRDSHDNPDFIFDFIFQKPLPDDSKKITIKVELADDPDQVKPLASQTSLSSPPSIASEQPVSTTSCPQGKEEF